LAPPYYSQRAVFASLWALFHSALKTNLVSISVSLLFKNISFSFSCKTMLARKQIARQHSSRYRLRSAVQGHSRSLEPTYRSVTYDSVIHSNHGPISNRLQTLIKYVDIQWNARWGACECSCFSHTLYMCLHCRFVVSIMFYTFQSSTCATRL